MGVLHINGWRFHYAKYTQEHSTAPVPNFLHRITRTDVSTKWQQTIKSLGVNTLRPRQDSRHFPDDIFKCILVNENVWISIKISLKFVPKGPINKIPALVPIMAWRRQGDKPSSLPVMVSLPTHICVTRPQWVNMWKYGTFISVFNYFCSLFQLNLDPKGILNIPLT